MDSARKELILQLHNKMRNEIAMGEMKTYSAAAKMPCFVSYLKRKKITESPIGI